LIEVLFLQFLRKVIKMIAQVKSAVINFMRDEEGASAIEYALIAAMVAVALVLFVTPIRTAISDIFTKIQTALQSGAA
jgi:pilus assembly protein Flp/PilA